jgi:myo-inositol-1(or 4)-monophosphatase
MAQPAPLSPHELTDLAVGVRDAAEAAGRRIQEIRQGVVTSSLKADESPVTEADRAADALLKERLTALLNCGWLSEETADAPERLSLERVWVVDPLDGTKEFVQQIPEYSVAVALVEGSKPVLGVVHNPAKGRTFWAVKGSGAYRDGERISVSEGNRLLASRSEMKRGEFEPFMPAWDVSQVGSIEYKLGLIAAGEGAVTLSRGPKWEWDVCAGGLIVREAGGVATDVFGGPLRFNQPFPKVKGILAGAPQAYERALEEVRALGPSDRMGELLE